jgi:formate hydrogenlyase transcriptional activator
MTLRTHFGSKRKVHFWPTLLVGVLAIKAALSLTLNPSFALVAFGTVLYFLLLLLSTAFAARNAAQQSKGSRMFWLFMASGSGLWALDQWLYVYYGIGLRMDVPDSSVADAALFLHVVPLMAAVAMRPHLQRSDQKPSRASLNFLLLLFFWVFLYAYVLFPYQYLWADTAIYNPRFTALYAVENAALVLVLGVLTFRAQTPWRSVYIHFFGASALYGASSTLANVAIDSGWQYNGSIYSLAQTAAVCWFVWVPLRARQLPLAEVKATEPDASRTGFTSLTATIAVVAIPLIGILELFRSHESSGMRTFRLSIVLASVLFLAMSVLLKEYLVKCDLVLDSRVSKLQEKLSEAALVRSEDRYRDLVEHSEELVCTHDLEGRLLSVNPAPARLLGYKVDELLKIPMRELIAPGYREQFDAYLIRIRANGADKGLLPVITRSGERRIWEYNNTLRTEGVAEPFVRGMARDITERKRAQEALRRSEAHFRILVEQAPDGIFISDAHGRYLDVNTAGAEMLGYTREEILGLSIPDVVASERVGHNAAGLPGSGIVRNEWKFRRKDGSFFPGEVYTRQLRGGRLQSILRDISERRLAEEAMRRSEERFRVALKDSPITVSNQDRDLRYTWMYNPQSYWQHDAIGKTDAEIIGRKKAARLNELKRRVLKTGVALREEVVIPDEGKNVAFDITIEPLFDVAGNVIGITAACMDIARLREITDRLQDTRDRLAQEKSYLESEIQAELGFEEIVGQSPALRGVLRQTRIVAPTHATVLLLGETGTGKELVARAVHSLSSRHDRTFIKLNCAAVPCGLLESELFGHEKGAFTSAVSQKVGRIELADKGTLFLDEIGELPLELQPKLLRVLQDREFERLGGVRTLHVDVRIIAATNRDLRQSIAEKKFREDLFYRLNVFPINLPALRERRPDIPILVRHFVQKHSVRMGKHIETIPDETMVVLENWNWPGNIRELENMIERMVILSKGRVLAAPPVELDAPQDVSQDSLTEMERDHIIRVLRDTNGVLSGTDGAASRLGIKRTTLQSMLKRLKIGPEDYRRGSGTLGPA